MNKQTSTRTFTPVQVRLLTLFQPKVQAKLWDGTEGDFKLFRTRNFGPIYLIGLEDLTNNKIVCLCTKKGCGKKFIITKVYDESLLKELDSIEW